MHKLFSRSKLAICLLPICSILALTILYHFSAQTAEESSRLGPGDPASEEAWLMMKKEVGTNLPENFTLDMYKRFHLGYRGSRTSDTNLEKIEEVGPTSVAGRIRAFHIDHSNPQRFLAAGISGGLWESMDSGETWTNLTPQEQHLNITSICQSPFDSDIFYFSTGEPAGNSAGIDGVGIFKSTDGGYNFDLIPASMVNEFFRTWRIVHSPIDTNTFFIASPDGLYVSRDGGEFFDIVLSLECTDLEVLPSGEMYAASDGRGVYYSKNGKQGSFKARGSGLPSDYGRMELATSPNYNFMVASLENPENGRLLDIYYSDNKARNWTVLPNPRDAAGLNTSFTWYCQTLYLHPTDSNFILFGASDGAYSYNRGQQWYEIDGVHADIHTATTDPANENDILITSDGGIDRLSGDGLIKTATSLNNEINITQFYTGAVFPSGHILGGTQDNGTWYGENISNEFSKVFGADGSYCAVNPIDPSEIFISYQNGNVYRIRNFFNNPQRVYITDDVQDSYDDHQFIAPFQLNPKKPNQLFLSTSSRVWWSDNSGDSWQPLTQESASMPYRSAFINRNGVTTLFLGGSNGLFYRLDNIEQHNPGDEINLRNSMPPQINTAFIREIIATPDEESLLVVMSSFAEEDRVWKVNEIYSNNPSWESISGDLTPFLPVNTIAIDPLDADLLAIGTDYGLFTSKNGGENWILERDIPQTVIYQIVMHEENVLNIFTHGRGVFKATLNGFVATKTPENQGVHVSVYPNPADEYISIEMDQPSDQLSGSIYDVSGKLVKSFKAIQNEQISIATLSSGSYSLLINANKQYLNRTTFVKK